jgi:hypothetical protein
VLDGPVLERGDLGVVPAVLELEAVGARHEPLEADATAAQHAALRVQHDRAQVHELPLADLLLRLDLGVVEAVLHVLVLEVALAGLIAHGAIDGVVDEEELQRGAVGLRRLLALRVHHHALGQLRIAGDLELAHLLDLDQAHAAVAVHGQVGVPAEMRDLLAHLEGGLDDRRARRGLDLLAVDDGGHHAGLGGRGRAGRGLGRLGLLLVAHRSSSPAMMFSPPMMATASASRPPLIICGNAW